MTSYIADSPYPTPIYVANNQKVNGDSAILDIGSCTAARMPPVLQGLVGTMTVKILGSHDKVNWVDYSGGGFTSDFSKDLIQGIRFWKTNVSNYASGALTAIVGAVADHQGCLVMPNLATYSNNVPLTSG